MVEQYKVVYRTEKDRAVVPREDARGACPDFFVQRLEALKQAARQYSETTKMPIKLSVSVRSW
jgi:hypothetical protein